MLTDQKYLNRQYITFSKVNTIPSENNSKHRTVYNNLQNNNI